MHEIIAELLDAHIVINMPGFFRTSYVADTFEHNQKVGIHKRYVRDTLAKNKNLYIRNQLKLD